MLYSHKNMLKLQGHVLHGQIYVVLSLFLHYSLCKLFSLFLLSRMILYWALHLSCAQPWRKWIAVVYSLSLSLSGLWFCQDTSLMLSLDIKVLSLLVLVSISWRVEAAALRSLLGSLSRTTALFSGMFCNCVCTNSDVIEGNVKADISGVSGGMKGGAGGSLDYKYNI